MNHEPVDYDVPCIGCGYNLRGLSRGGRCPECSKEIEPSLGERPPGRITAVGMFLALVGVALALGPCVCPSRLCPEIVEFGGLAIGWGLELAALVCGIVAYGEESRKGAPHSPRTKAVLCAAVPLVLILGFINYAALEFTMAVFRNWFGSGETGVPSARPHLGGEGEALFC